SQVVTAVASIFALLSDGASSKQIAREYSDRIVKRHDVLHVVLFHQEQCAALNDAWLTGINGLETSAHPPKIHDAMLLERVLQVVQSNEMLRSAQHLRLPQRTVQ